MEKEKLKNISKRNGKSSSIELLLDFESYIEKRKKSVNQKVSFDYNNRKLELTPKQINVLKLVAKGLSNTKIANELSVQSAAVKLSIYRIIKYLEYNLNERIDRFNLVILAQKLDYKEQKDL